MSASRSVKWLRTRCNTAVTAAATHRYRDNPPALTRLHPERHFRLAAPTRTEQGVADASSLRAYQQ
jgi:hypothetical protein